jgi:hypothetical protein
MSFFSKFINFNTTTIRQRYYVLLFTTTTITTSTLFYSYFNLRPLRPFHTDHDPEFIKTGLYVDPTVENNIWTKLTRSIILTLVTGVMKFHLQCLNTLEIINNKQDGSGGGDDDDPYHILMTAIKNPLHSTHRRNRGLLTVANHTSVLDDPGLQAALVGFEPALINSNHMRWGVCKESICFKNSLVGAFTGAGKVFPIVVGNGLEQSMFRAVGRKLAEGDWVHVYPEAAALQSGSLGTGYFAREVNRVKELGGRLKWGVGKLIARIAFENREPPLVIP